MMKSSLLFPIMVETGSIIMHIDPAEVGSDINDTIDEGVKAAQEQIDEVKESVADKVDETLDESAKKIKQSVKEHIEENNTKGE